MSDATTALAAAQAAAASSTTASEAADFAAEKAVEVNADRVAAETARTDAEAFALGFDAGTATTLAPGATPTLAITGPAGARVLDLGIPAGLADDPSMTAVADNPASAFRASLSTTIAADQPSNARKSGVTTATADVKAPLETLFADMLASDKAGYIPKGEYDLATPNPTVNLPAGARFSLRADPGTMLKVTDGSASADYHQALLLLADGTGDVESVDVEGLGIDHNRRGQTLPAVAADWEHSASIRVSGASATARILEVKLRNLRFRDPIADCVWFNSYYVDRAQISDMTVRDRNGVRSDIAFSAHPRVTQISDYIGKRIESEPIAVPVDVTHDFIVQVSNAQADLFDLAGRSDAPTRFNWVIDNAEIGDLSAVYLNDLLITNSRIHFPLNPFNNREIKYNGNAVFDNCDIYIYADASGVIAPMRMLGNTVRLARGRFSNCRFHLVPTSGYAGTFTGKALEFTPRVATLPPEWTVEDCWFDERFPYSIFGDRCGSLTLKDNDYGGTTAAFQLVQSATLPTRFVVDGGDWGRVTGACYAINAAVGGEMHFRNVEQTAARATPVLTGTMTTLPLYNSRLIHTGTALTGSGLRPDQPGIRGDRARLTSPAVGAPYEWFCTTSSATTGTWEPVSSVEKLLSTTALNGKTASAVTLYTVPAGRTAVITRAVVRCTGATAITSPATLGVGIAAGEDDLFPAVSMVGLTAAGKVWDLAPAASPAGAPAGSVIKSGIDVGAVGTSLAISVDLYGYLI